MENQEITSKLLRLKRYEMPPPGYHEKFLRDFQRRQRAELIRTSPWQMLWEGVCSLWPNFQVPRMAYATCAAVALAAGAWMVSQPAGSDLSQQTTLANLNRVPDFSLEPKTPVTISNTLPVSGGSPRSSHYVLQPRPASSDSPLSF